MKYAFLVAVREYAENAKTKGFWLGMLMLPAIIFISVKASVLLETKGTPTRYYAVVDQSGKFAAAIESRLKGSDWNFSAESGRAGKSRRQFQIAPLPVEINTNASFSELAQALKPYLRGEKDVAVDGRPVELYAALLVPPDIEKQIIRPHAHTSASGDGIEYWSANLADTALRDELEYAVNDEIRRREYLARGLDIAAIREVDGTHAPFASLDPNKQAGQETVSAEDTLRQWAPSGFVYLLWVAIFGIVQMLLNNIIEEKSNRIIEVLLSSVTPGELMMGKLFGIAAVGLTMVSVWVGTLFLSLTLNSHGATQMAGPLLQTLKTSNLIPMFAVYFLFGYLMYASFILALGSVCNTIKEAQNYMGLIVMMLMVPLVTMPFIPKDPNGTLARVLSWIPVYTPFTMMNRVNANPPLVDVIGTILLLIASTAAAMWMAGKVFRIGILRTGQPPKILELLRWLKS